MNWGIPGAAILPPPMASSPMAPMNIQKNVVRIGEQAFWSSQSYADATALASTQDRIFVTPRGQTGQGFAGNLSIAETNLKEGGRIPSGYAYDVEAVAVQPYYINNTPLAGADLRNLQNHCVILWDFINTQIEIAPAQLIGSGGGIFGATADTGAAEGGAGGSRIALNNGNGQLWIYRRHPVMLPSNATFGMILSWGSSAVAVDGGIGNARIVFRLCLLGRFQNAIATA